MIFETLWDCETYREESALLRAACDGVEDHSVLLAADLTTPRPVIDRLIAARRSGTLVALYPALVDPYEDAIAIVASHIAGLPTLDERRTVLRALGEGKLQVNGGRIADLAPLDEQRRSAIAFACKLADVILFATEADRQRFQAMLRRVLVRFTFIDLPDPGTERSDANHAAVCIYAPSTPRDRLQFAELALQGRSGRVDVIARSDEREIPFDTGVVVCPEWWRPIRAASVAAEGFRVVAPRTGGADERGHALVYSESDASSLRRAVVAATFEPPPSVNLRPMPGSVAGSLRRHAAQRVTGPLVSVIVRTFDRPALLERALESIAAQTYRSIEAIVVNGGGIDVQGCINLFRDRLSIIYIDAQRRTLVAESANIGARAASGEFIAYLDDDDLLYPDHIARCADALLRTGRDIVYTNSVAEYAEMHGTAKQVLGFTMYLDQDFDRDALYVNNIATIHSIMHRKDVFERFGCFDESFPVCEDWEMWSRIANGGDFIHLDRATCEYSWRWDAERSNNTTLSQQDKFVTAHGRIYEQHGAQLADRPSIISEQVALLKYLRDRTYTIGMQPERARELLFRF